MKAENEKKKTRSIKVSDNQYAIIKQKADERHMSFSEFVVDCAVHGNHSLTPEIAVQVQSIVNTVNDLADRLSSEEYKTKDRLYQQSKDLDDLFDQSPLKDYAEIVKNIDKIAEGADSLWVYLK
jgi:hypothetical protein